MSVVPHYNGGGEQLETGEKSRCVKVQRHATGSRLQVTDCRLQVTGIQHDVLIHGAIDSIGAERCVRTWC
jgi:hypothetical protein